MQYFLKPPLLLFTIFLLIAYVAGPVHGLNNPRKLDETPGVPNGDQKCGSCTQSPPPPSPSPPPPSPPPPSPCPPPPALPPPVLPPPSPKKSPPSTTPYCPPPPSSGLIYITGPPGQLYPIDRGFNGASRSLGTRLPVLLGIGLLGLLAFW